MWESCGAGSASACNALLFEATAGSEYEAFAFSCGGRENLHCSVLLGGDPNEGGLLAADFEPRTPAPGNISELDGWWEACGDGSSRACAQLVLSAPGGSAYATFGWTCGGRTTLGCAGLLGDDGPPPGVWRDLLTLVKSRRKALDALEERIITAAAEPVDSGRAGR